MFVILDPTTFPATISGLPSITAKIEENSSGREVPNATMVTPTMKGEILSQRPTFSDAWVNLSADFESKYNETANIKNHKDISMISPLIGKEYWFLIVWFF